jgi:ArsR family transcriptional regulator
MRTKQIVISRKAGNQVFYSVRDPRIIEVLDIMRSYFYSQLTQDQVMLKQIKRQGANS